MIAILALTTERVSLSMLPDAAQRAPSKAAPAKPADVPAEKTVAPADASPDAKLAAVRINGAIADELKKLDTAIQGHHGRRSESGHDPGTDG